MAKVEGEKRGSLSKVVKGNTTFVVDEPMPEE